MRKKIVAGNWKMHKTATDARALITPLLKANIDPAKTSVVLMPPFIYLSEFSAMPHNPGISLGAQHSFYEKEGAYTGEISAYMLQSLGVTHCLVGHSERRKYFNELDIICLEKVKALMEQKITPVLCVGEELEVREAGTHFDHVKTQLLPVLTTLKPTEITKLVIAYEPVWAIGTGKTASVQQAAEMHAHIRRMFAVQFDVNIASQVHILYGGSVNENNAKELMNAGDIDGVLVGGASLKSDVFLKIIEAAG